MYEDGWNRHTSAVRKTAKQTASTVGRTTLRPGYIIVSSVSLIWVSSGFSSSGLSVWILLVGTCAHLFFDHSIA